MQGNDAEISPRFSPYIVLRTYHILLGHGARWVTAELHGIQIAPGGRESPFRDRQMVTIGSVALFVTADIFNFSTSSCFQNIRISSLES